MYIFLAIPLTACWELPPLPEVEGAKGEGELFEAREIAIRMMRWVDPPNTQRPVSFRGETVVDRVVCGEISVGDWEGQFSDFEPIIIFIDGYRLVQTEHHFDKQSFADQYKEVCVRSI